MDEIWDTLDALYKTVRARARQVEELEARVEALERRLSEVTNERPALRVVNDFSEEEQAVTA